MTTGTTVPYATKRFREHLHNFQELARQVENDALEAERLTFLEGRTPIFPVIEFTDAIPPRQAVAVS